MKYRNITALLLGVFVAGLLWEYYLKPKYQIKMGDEEVLSAIAQADIAALNEATAAIEGEVLFKDYGEGAEFKNDIINNSSGETEEFDFHSTANRKPDFFEQAAMPLKKTTKIILEDDSPVMNPEDIAAEQGVALADSTELPNRITMIRAPARFSLISSAADYKKYKAENKGEYPSVDFKKERIVFVESDSMLSNGFFQVADYEDTPDKIIVRYRVNIFGAEKRDGRAPYIIIPFGDKKVAIEQIK
ncbi:hypothetical protein [Candidatus Proelusimicrobium volucris]|uniref:hypothetical protein n=1 Tax=Candidatus Proelusimicrobium volucris TaxID=3416225 RepID=UPI003D0A79F3